MSELESSQSIASSELGAVERANTSLREQRAELIDEISELKRDHALQMKQQQALVQAVLTLLLFYFLVFSLRKLIGL